MYQKQKKCIYNFFVSVQSHQKMRLFPIVDRSMEKIGIVQLYFKVVIVIIKFLGDVIQFLLTAKINISVRQKIKAFHWLSFKEFVQMVISHFSEIYYSNKYCVFWVSVNFYTNLCMNFVSSQLSKLNQILILYIWSKELQLMG